MSRIPAYPYRVIVQKNVGHTVVLENHNFENFAKAIAYREIALRKQLVRRVEVVMVLDESTPTHK